MAGLVRCVFYLIILLRTSFWPQMDKVYLFLAAAPQKTQLSKKMACFKCEL